MKRLINSFVAEYQLDDDWAEFGTEGLMVAVALQHFYPGFFQEILGRTDDTIGELLTFAAARSWLQTGNPPIGEDRERQVVPGQPRYRHRSRSGRRDAAPAGRAAR